MDRFKSALIGIVVLGLSIAIPYSISAPWQLYVLWIVIGVAVLLFIGASGWQRLPWRLERKTPEIDEAIGRMVSNYVLRGDVKNALHRLNTELNETVITVTELRAFAQNLSKRLRDDGYEMSAAKVEVNLPDNAEIETVKKRRGEIWDSLVRMLIWDEFR